MKKHIPNCLSICNLLSGAIGTALALHGALIYAAYAIFVGAFFDFLDGLVAKLFRAQSPIGKQLDSLADLITFGMLPASILYMLIKTYESCPYRPYVALLMVALAALRLAKFNVDDRQTDQFIGLPTPASALIVATLPIILQRAAYPCLVDGLTQPLVLPLLTILLSFLLVSNTSFIALKFKGVSFQVNRLRYFLIGLWLFLVVVMKFEGIFFGAWFYIFFSLCNAKTG